MIMIYTPYTLYSFIIKLFIDPFVKDKYNQIKLITYIIIKFYNVYISYKIIYF